MRNLRRARPNSWALSGIRRSWLNAGVSKEAMAGEYYRALMRCRKLIACEAERLGLAQCRSKRTSAAATQAEQPCDLEYRAFGQVTAALSASKKSVRRCR